MHQMTSDWPWTLNSHKYPVYMVYADFLSSFHCCCGIFYWYISFHWAVWRFLILLTDAAHSLGGQSIHSDTRMVRMIRSASLESFRRYVRDKCCHTFCTAQEIQLCCWGNTKNIGRPHDQWWHQMLFLMLLSLLLYCFVFCCYFFIKNSHVNI